MTSTRRASYATLLFTQCVVGMDVNDGGGIAREPANDIQLLPRQSSRQRPQLVLRSLAASRHLLAELQLRDIDVLMYGNETPRCMAIVGELRWRGFNCLTSDRQVVGVHHLGHPAPRQGRARPAPRARRTVSFADAHLQGRAQRCRRCRRGSGAERDRESLPLRCRFCI